jgi:hypothetical protein
VKLQPPIESSEEEPTQTVTTLEPELKRAIYPEVNFRYMGWLGIAFVAMVFLVQHFSGYS